MTREELIAEAERLLAHARSAKARGADNLPETEADRSRYGADLSKVRWEDFVDKADMHYFVGRILMTNGAMVYGFFCAQQSVENYLKGYLRFAAQSIPQHHKLVQLLNACRSNCPDQSSFLHTDNAETICQIFDPFYETPRYPAQITRPKDGKYVMFSGEEAVMDYFVLRMREILVLPAGSWDILTSQGNFSLWPCNELHPTFYALFTRQNPILVPAQSTGSPRLPQNLPSPPSSK